jgi:DNA mismatch repair protein MutL
MSGEARIRVLNDAVINKIAAGEVVDRPASVVKELVENALDAGSTRVEVEAVAGGKTLVAVTDNGRGMSRDDALLCLERHATSKIRDVADIEHIATLGFRGEALAAIASVSRMTLQTAAAGETGGTEIAIHGGRILDVKDAGCPVGTRIVVRNLFFNVPARRKFLRTEQTEFAQVRQLLMPYALAWPEIGFRLVSDGREIFNLPPGAGLMDRLTSLYGRPVTDALRPVEHEQDGVRVQGFVSLPQASRADRAEQYVFINRRPAGAPVLQHALNEAYQALLPRGRYPVVFLFLRLDAGDVDVNVHPTKKEVRFRRPGDVRDALIEAVRGALGAPSAGALAAAPAPSAPPAPWSHPPLSIPDLPPARVFAYPRLPMTPPPGPGAPAAPGAAAPAADSPAGLSGGSPWAWCRVVGQVGGLFVVLETEDGLVLMDPHAAHERVLFDRLMREALAGTVRSQGLLMPVTVQAGGHDAEIVRRNLPALQAMGFGIAEFGGDAFVIDAVPAVLGAAFAPETLSEIAATLEGGGERGGTERWLKERIATAACRAAVKARDTLKLEEIEKLVVELAGTDMPYTCPHGRPTLIHFGFSELYRKFGRA